MKTNKFLTLILAFVATIAITSCVQDDDYTIPNSLGEEENAGLQQILADLNSGALNEVTIEEAKMMYDAVNELPFEVDTDIVIKGYVSSSDRTGNFYKELYIQDNYENPTAAIKVIINQTDLYNKFNKGREVYIKLKGLYIGEERTGNGVITIGGGTETDQYGTTVTSLGQTLTNAKMFRSPTTMDMIPLSLSFGQVSNTHIGMYVIVDNVEFPEYLEGKRYFDPLEDFDTQRLMQACGGFEYANLILETSSFSDFKNELLPMGNGTIAGIIAKDYFGDVLLMAINTTDDVNFSNARCTLLNPADFSEIFGEDFQNITDNQNLNIPGWVNFAEVGGELWTEQLYQGVGTAEFSGYGTNDAVNIGWLVSPGIDMDAQDNEFLNFKTAQHHLDTDSEDNGIKVFVSTDFDGTDVMAATWEEKNATFPTSGSSWYDLVDSGLIDLSGYTGTLYVAFRSTASGQDQSLDGAYQIDDFSIIAEN
ncbi:MAG: DUF5689 domain-containing protein [Oceanihabitans sp.]